MNTQKPNNVHSLYNCLRVLQHMCTLQTCILIPQQIISCMLKTYLCIKCVFLRGSIFLVKYVLLSQPLHTYLYAYMHTYLQHMYCCPSFTAHYTCTCTCACMHTYNTFVLATECLFDTAITYVHVCIHACIHTIHVLWRQNLILRKSELVTYVYVCIHAYILEIECDFAEICACIHTLCACMHTYIKYVHRFTRFCKIAFSGFKATRIVRNGPE